MALLDNSQPDTNNLVLKNGVLRTNGALVSMQVTNNWIANVSTKSVHPTLPLQTRFFFKESEESKSGIGLFFSGIVHEDFDGNVLRKEPISIQGDGTPRRSYLYGADLAIWLWTMLFRAPSLTTINVGSDEDLSIQELAQKVAHILDPDTVIKTAGSPMPGVPPSRYVPSVNRAKELLGLEQTVSLEESIRRTADWYGPQ